MVIDKPDIKKVRRETQKKIISSVEMWKDFLKTSSNLYKYDFSQQVLIYAQNPNVTACATEEIWNKLKHEVPENTETIAILKDNGDNRDNLQYVFDIKDVKALSSNTKEPYIWQMKGDYEDDIINKLSANYDISLGTQDFEYSISQLIQSITDEYCNRTEVFRDFCVDTQNSLLEEYDELNLNLVFRNVVTASVENVILERLDYKIDIIDDYMDNRLDSIIMFNTPKILSNVGLAVNTISSELLNEIGSIVKLKDKELQKEALQSEYDRDNISQRGEISNSEHSSGERHSGGENRKVRENEEKISEKPSSSEIPTTTVGGGTLGTPSGSGHIGGGDDESDSKSNETISRSDGRTQSSRPNEMGSDDEQHSPASSRDSDGGSNTYIDNIDEDDNIYIGEIIPEELIFQEAEDGIDVYNTLDERKVAKISISGDLNIYTEFLSQEAIEKLELVADSMVEPEDIIAEELIFQEAEDGIDVYNMLDESKVANISVEGNLTVYNEFLSEEVLEKLELVADSMTESEVLENEETSKIGIEEISETSELEDSNLETKEKTPPIYFFEDFDKVKHNIDLKSYPEDSIVGFDRQGSCYRISMNNDNGLITSRETALGGDGYPRLSTSAIQITNIDNLQESFGDWLNDLYNQDTITPELVKFASDGNSETIEEVVKEPAEPIIASGYAEIDGGLVEEVGITEINQEKSNFKIDNFELGHGTSKEKFNKNILAIETLNQIEIENRTATQEEQKILHEYVGWGGVPEAFDTSKENWANEQDLLKSLLSKEDYDSASASVLNSHYTPPIVIEAIFSALQKMNLPEDVSILDPALGVGNFFGMLPESFENANLFGVELDNISGRIAKELYPNANIKISGFEKVNLEDNTFDVSIGNVPFGDTRLNDIENRHNKFVIHDFFFAKTLDKVKNGGIIAFITSKGTLDKATSTAREYLAKNADLLGAIRLPNDTFKKNANTSVTSDVIFLQKREEPQEIMPSWVNVSENENGIKLNNYFIENPDMALGKLELVSTQFGMDLACIPHENSNFKDLLEVATEKIIKPDCDRLRSNIEAEVSIKDIINIFDDKYDSIKNFSYTIIDNNLYFKEDSKLNLFDGAEKQEILIKDLIEVRDATRELIDMQVDNCSDDELKIQQEKLNALYDNFSKNHSIINSQAVKRAFSDDVSYPLLCSLEVLDDENKLKGKADIFTKRTIKQIDKIESVDTPLDALTVSISERGKVDLEFMSELLAVDRQKGEKIDFIVEELNSKGIIFKDPICNDENAIWITEDEYLSGNVVDKLAFVKHHAENNPEFSINVEYLEKVQPEPILATEIDVRIGATWIDATYYTQFMQELFKTPRYLDETIVVQFSEATSEFAISNKSQHRGVLIDETFGTPYKSSYSLLEDSLNLRDSLIYRTEKNANDKEVKVLDSEKTRIVQAKQEDIAQNFKDWIFATPERREDLAKKYNNLFNNTRPRSFNGENIKFEGMNSEINLNPHQKDAVARTLFGGNTLLAHCVGAGKTYTMVASAMEGKRLGLHNKALFVVPNHLTEQIGSDVYKLYPNSNVLVATKKDFTPENRKKFCSKIATGNFDAVIIGHTQFEKIPLSKETQEAIFEKQINDITDAISSSRYDRSPNSRFTIKQLEKTKKSLEVRLEKLSALEKKDNVVTFEQLGVDKLYVDEAHSFKNLFLHTKMRNVAGIGQSEAQKSTDMFSKCQYLDKLTGNKGIVFATGTPLSNSMTELYTLMRYLQYDTLEKMNLKNFDAWASTFGERVTKLDIAPEGTGFRMKTSFSKFFNLDELVNLWKNATDVKTADMLDLKVPNCEHITIVTKPSEFQKQILETFVERADSVRSRKVLPEQDNMLKITNDGRKMALDQRLIDDLLQDNPDSKLNKCNENVFKIWEDTKETRGTQLIFCDLSTPKPDKFNAYDDIRNKLVEKGIPKDEIAFIHDAKTEVQKDKLFKQVRKGDVRILLGSTEKMGAGTNVQDRLVALHHTDCPWRPSDIEQREGRIVRQGNQNENVKIFKYVTEGTFDAYNWSLLEQKQNFISQVFTSKPPSRSIDDMDNTTLSFAEIKILATGNPQIKEKMELDVEVHKLGLLRSNHMKQKFNLEDKLIKTFPKELLRLENSLEVLNNDLIKSQENPINDKNFKIEVQGITYTDKKVAGEKIIDICKDIKPDEKLNIGNFRGFNIKISFEKLLGSASKFVAELTNSSKAYSTDLENNALGNITRLNNAIENIPKFIEQIKQKIQDIRNEIKIAEVEVTKPFQKEAEYKEKVERLKEIDEELNKIEKGGQESELSEEDKALNKSNTGKEESRKSITETLGLSKQEVKEYNKTNVEEEPKKTITEMLGLNKRGVEAETKKSNTPKLSITASLKLNREFKISNKVNSVKDIKEKVKNAGDSR